MIIINDKTYAASSWQATLLIFASVIGIGLFNMFGAKHLPLGKHSIRWIAHWELQVTSFTAEGIFVASHFFAFFPVIIVILVLAPKTTPEKVFVTFTDNGAGWPTIAWATLVGQVSAMFSLLGEPPR